MNLMFKQGGFDVLDDLRNFLFIGIFSICPDGYVKETGFDDNANGRFYIIHDIALDSVVSNLEELIQTGAKEVTMITAVEDFMYYARDRISDHLKW